MSSMSLQQIQSRLEKLFYDDDKRIVFWYDENQAFSEEYEGLSFTDITKLQLKIDEQFKTKILLERVDPSSKYLLYAPYQKPDSSKNHLLDMELYSAEVFTDRVSMVMQEQGIQEDLRGTLANHRTFFDAKIRMERFIRFDLKTYTEETTILAMLCAVANVKILSLEELLKYLFALDEKTVEEYLAELKRYKLTSVFWDKIGRSYQYNSENPKLLDFMTQLFITYSGEKLKEFLPVAWKKHSTLNPTNTTVLLDGLMYDSRYRDSYKGLSQKISQRIHAEQELSSLSLEALLPLNIFPTVDTIMLEKLLILFQDENISKSPRGKSVEDICDIREDLYYGTQFLGEYHAVKYAYRLLSLSFEFQIDSFESAIKEYTEKIYLYDFYYRKFIFYVDTIDTTNKPLFEELQTLVETAYTHRYLDDYIPKWSHAYLERNQENMSILNQVNFYSKKVASRSERIVVIISDALRYEVAVELKNRMNRNAKMDVHVEPMVANVPTVTSVGMASLLPHNHLDFDGKQATIDGQPSNSLEQREKLLQAANEKSVALRSSDVHRWKQEELRERVIGQQVIYIYHNQIDAIGDDSKTHHDVFKACDETINEIETLVSSLTNSISATNYILTADHGFLYKRDAIEENHKITNDFDENDIVTKRFALSEQPLNLPGVVSVKTNISTVGNTLSFPLSSHIFKTTGGSQNYVHGGISPQELVIPFVTMTTSKGRKETRVVKMSPVILPTKITNLVTRIEFVQNEAISDIALPANYRFYFQTGAGETISNISSYYADSKIEETRERMFSISFELKDRKYTVDETYFLVIENEQSEYDASKHQVKIEILFAGNFRF